MKKVLITGVSGMLGGNLARFLNDLYVVEGWYHSYPVRIPGVLTSTCDMENSGAVASSIQAVRPDVVIHCAARIDVDRMEEDRDASWNMNVVATENLVSVLAPETQLVHISTDAVYGGTTGNYSERMKNNPKNWYGQTKLEAEHLVARHANSLILRVNFYGWNRYGKMSLAEWFISKFEAGKSFGGFGDAIFSPLYTMDLGRIIDECIEGGVTGTYNCCSRDSISKLEFGRKIAKLFGYPLELLKEISIDDMATMVPRGKNLSMSVAKLEGALKHQLPTVDESLSHFKADYGTAVAEKLGSSIPE